MTTIRPEHIPPDIPFRVQLDRLRLLGGQLKGFLGRYHQEPQTREQFIKRELLRSRLQTLQKRCVEFRVSGEKDLPLLDRSGRELDLLIREFRNLEIQVKGFMQR